MSKVSLDVAQRLDITCRKGDTFNLVVNVTNSSGVTENLTSYSFKMQLRETDVSTLPTIDDSQMTITGSSGGVLTVTIPSSVMANISSGLYVYDLQTIKGGITQTWLTGVITVNEDVTV
jgi:hypothetical protein